MLTSHSEHRPLPLHNCGRAPQGASCEHEGPQLDNVDELTARAFHAFGRMMHVNRLVMAKMGAQRGGRKGAHHGEVVALALLSRRDGMSQRELGEALHLSPPRVSSILDSLEKRGSVVRTSDETDRRLTRVNLTQEGKKRVKEQSDALGGYVNRTIGALSEADRTELVRLLDELADRTLAVLNEPSDGEGRAEGGVSG